MRKTQITPSLLNAHRAELESRARHLLDAPAETRAEMTQRIRAQFRAAGIVTAQELRALTAADKAVCSQLGIRPADYIFCSSPTGIEK